MLRTLKWTLPVALLAVAVGLRADDKKDDKTAKDDSKPVTDAEFVMKAASGGIHEVELGKLAAAQGKSDEVKKFGQQMVDDHGKANEQLKAAAKKAGIEVSEKMSADHQKHFDHFKDLKGEEFDREYIKHMVKDHEEDVALFTSASKGLKDEGLRDFAAKTLPTIQKHLDMVKKMDKSGK